MTAEKQHWSQKWWRKRLQWLHPIVDDQPQLDSRTDLRFRNNALWFECYNFKDASSLRVYHVQNTMVKIFANVCGLKKI